MRFESRLVVKKHWGVRDPAFYWCLTSPLAWKDAVRRGHLSSVFRYRLANEGKEFNSDDIGTFPIGLACRRVFPEAANKKDAWADAVHNQDYLEEYASPFNGDVPGLGHTSDEAGGYQSIPGAGGFQVTQDDGFCWRVFILKPPEDLELPICYANWGQGNREWQFQIARGNCAIMHLAPTWSQAGEDALFLLMAAENRTAQQNEDMETLRTTLYTDYKPIALKSDTSNSFGEFYDLMFIPEPCGKISIYQGDELVDEADFKQVLETRRDGIIWKASGLNVRNNGGHFFWQVGYPEFIPPGVMRFPYSIDYATWGTTSAQLTAIKSTPTGTSITMEDVVDNPDNPTSGEIVITLNTTNPRRTPFLYAAQAYIDPEERDADTEDDIVLDTADKTDDQGNGPVMRVKACHEGEFRRAQYTLSVRNKNRAGNTAADATFVGLGSRYEVGEHRVGDLYQNDTKVLTNGLIKFTLPNEVLTTEEGLARWLVMGAAGQVELKIYDQWGLLEEYELEPGELVGDGLAVGVLIKRALKLIGTRTGALASIENGRILPRAVAGETWAVVSDGGTLADFLTRIVEQYGMGRILWIDADANWHFQRRSRLLKVLHGHPVQFSSDPALHHPETYPGRFAMLRPLDTPRDVGDFYNSFRVQGANGLHGQPLVRDWIVQESIHRGGGPGSKKYIGRVKPMPTVHDSSLRTGSEVQLAARSLAMRYSKPPRYITFETYYHEGLFIGDVCSADGVYGELVRAPEGDTKDDLMQITLQELE